MAKKTAKKTTKKTTNRRKNSQRKKRPIRARARRGSPIEGRAAPRSSTVWLKPSAIVIDEKWNARNYEHFSGTGAKTEHVTKEPGQQMSDAELLADIKQHGLIQNLVVRKNPEGKGHVLTVGFRRHRALMSDDDLRDKPVLCVEQISSGDESEDEFKASAMNLSENLNRRNLRTFEIADKLFRMRKARPDITSKELAKRTGLSYPYVSALLRIRTKAIAQLWDLFCQFGTNFGNGITYKDMLTITALAKGEQLEAWKKLVAERTGKNSKGAKEKKGPKPAKPKQLEEYLGMVDTLGGSADWKKGVRFGLLLALGRQTWTKKKKAAKKKAAKKATKKAAKKKTTKRTTSKSNSRSRARA